MALGEKLQEEGRRSFRFNFAVMETPDAFVGVLEAERDRLQNAVDHLVASNQDLKQAIEEAGPDRDFKEAIEENIVVIAKYKARIERLDKEIAELRRGLQLLEQGQAILAGQAPDEQQQQQPLAAGRGDEQVQEAGSEQPDAVMQDVAGQQQQQQQQVEERPPAPPQSEQGGGVWL